VKALPGCKKVNLQSHFKVCAKQRTKNDVNGEAWLYDSWQERKGKCTWCAFNPLTLSPNSDKHLISPYSIITWSNIQVRRIKEIITKDKLSWCVSKFSWLVPNDTYQEQWGEHMLILGIKGINPPLTCL